MESTETSTVVGLDETAEGSIPLDQFRTGQCATICEVRADDREAGQLMAMGVCVGRTVMLLRRGDPLILKVLGSRIGVSSRLASRVRIVPCHEDGCDCENCLE
jgi:Fe2+ transport system protein FeoA